MQENKQNQGKCKQCITFYASQAYDGYCSSCYKKVMKNKQQQLSTSKVEPVTIKNVNQNTKVSHPASRKDTADTVEQNVNADQQKPIQKDRKKCFNCNKKLGLLGIQCKCGYVYCNGHRLPEDHNCSINYADEGKKKLQKQVIKVYNGKITQI